MRFMRIMPCAAVVSALVSLGACSGRGGVPGKDFPENFNSLPDTAKVSFVMGAVGPDSVARFICDAALGKVKEGRIDTLAVAAAYAYGHYADSCLIEFSRAFDSYSESLPLAEKMEIYYMAGELDPQRLGYELGLEFVDHIRQNKLGVDDVRREISGFKRACGEDTVTYIRFMKGFRTVLKADRGKDLPENIYTAFIEE